MLFLEGGQKKLILVVIPEKKKKEINVCVYICVGGRGQLKIGVKTRIARNSLPSTKGC